MHRLFPIQDLNLLPLDGSLKLAESFLSVGEANDLYNKIEKETQWQQLPIKIFGKEVMQPRLIAWFGDADTHYTYSGLTFESTPFTLPLLGVKQRIEDHVGICFNGVLVNFYRNGLDSMGWHSDDEMELGNEPIIASLSVGSARTFKMRHKMEKDKKISLTINNGDLLLMEGKTQEFWQHSVPKTLKPCGPRINLTFRRIL